MFWPMHVAFSSVVSLDLIVHRIVIVRINNNLAKRTESCGSIWLVCIRVDD